MKYSSLPYTQHSDRHNGFHGNSVARSNGVITTTINRGPSHYECGIPLDSTWKKSPKEKCALVLMKCLNAFGIGYCVTVLSIIMYYSLRTTMPYVYQNHPDLLLSRQMVALYLCLSIMLNYALCVGNNSYYVPGKTQHQGLVDRNWGQCLDCNQLIPPRAHHCTLCRGCILKRDHHCFFTGCCVGFYNQRFFIGFLFHVMIGCSYGLYLLTTFIQSEYGSLYQGLVWYQYIHHFFLPVTIFEFVAGYLDIHETVYVLVGYLMFASGAGAAVAFTIEMYLVSQGMTAFEMKQLGIRSPGKRRLGENLKGVFGDYWLLNFVVPLPWIKPKGNGVDWYSNTKVI